MNTNEKIITEAGMLFAKHGYEGVSMSIVAKKSNIAKSVIYYHYKDKNILLKNMFDNINSQLGVKRSQLSIPKTAALRMKQVIRFQFENAPKVVSVLKYYATFRKQFVEQEEGGYIPTKAYLHIEEVLEFGVKTGEFQIKNLIKDAKVITHAINGFVLEYYPDIPKEVELEKLVDDIGDFIMRAIVTNSQSKGGEKK